MCLNGKYLLRETYTFPELLKSENCYALLLFTGPTGSLYESD